MLKILITHRSKTILMCKAKCMKGMACNSERQIKQLPAWFNGKC